MARREQGCSRMGVQMYWFCSLMTNLSWLTHRAGQCLMYQNETNSFQSLMHSTWMSKCVFVTFTFLCATVYPKLWQFLIGNDTPDLHIFVSVHVRVVCACLCVCMFVGVCSCVCVCALYGKYYGLNAGVYPYNLYIRALISNMLTLIGGAFGR